VCSIWSNFDTGEEIDAFHGVTVASQAQHSTDCELALERLCNTTTTTTTNTILCRTTCVIQHPQLRKFYCLTAAGTFSCVTCIVTIPSCVILIIISGQSNLRKKAASCRTHTHTIQWYLPGGASATHLTPDLFSCFAQFVTVTDRLSDHTAQLVTIGHIYVCSTAMRLIKSFGSVIFRSSRQNVVGHGRASFPNNCPFTWGSVPHLICGSSCPPDSASQMASQSAQPFLHS